MRQVRLVGIFLVLWLVAFIPVAWPASSSVFLEDLTWTEVRDALQAGKTTVIIPVGGTEQSGPHMGLGKHNARVKVLADKIASDLGNTLVAPVVAYAPEGSISPPVGHMRFPGTISVSPDAFKAILDGAARSLKQHGFINIVLIGDHGGYQHLLKEVASHLNREWAATPTRVHFIADYYQAANINYVQVLREQGLSEEKIGRHAGAADTSLMIATDASLVRTGELLRDPRKEPNSGIVGDPRAATLRLGKIGVDLIVSQTVMAIRAAQNRQR